MNPIFTAALEIQNICHEQGWRFCFIGGLALQRWGEPRLTQDVDLTVISGFGNEAAYVDALLGSLSGRLEDARAFALRNRVLLLRSSGGVPIDVALGAMPFEERATTRASDFLIESSASLRTCSAEDLIVFKVFAGRERDWLDVESIVSRQADHLDRDLVWEELLPLLELKEDQESKPRLQEILRNS